VSKHRIGLALALVLLLGAAARAETLRVAGDPWPPYVDSALPHSGLAAGIVRTALERAGYDTRFTVAEWSFVLDETQAGRFDAIAAAWYSKERASEFALSQPYLENEIVLVKKRGAPFSFAEVAAGKRSDLVLGIVRGYAYGGALEPLAKMPTRIYAYLTESLLRLVQGDVDVTLDDRRALGHHVRQFLKAHEANLEIAQQPLTKLPLCLAVSRARPDHAQIVKAFDAALAKMRTDGTLAKLLAEYE
jgi:polar amino acid transport system substrate-binding protein